MNINREQAITMLHDVIDGEVSDEMRVAFFQYLNGDAYLRVQYEQARLLKDALKNRLPKAQLPVASKERLTLLALRLAAGNRPGVLARQNPGCGSVTREMLSSTESPEWFTFRFWIKPLRTAAAAAVLLAMTLFTIEILDQSTVTQVAGNRSMDGTGTVNGSEAMAEQLVTGGTEAMGGQVVPVGAEATGGNQSAGGTEAMAGTAPPTEGTQPPSLEQMVYELFSDTGSFHKDPSWSFSPDVRMERVQVALQTELQSSARLPKMDERHLRRIYEHTFPSNVLSPVLAYLHEQTGEWIYVFSFEIRALEASEELHRDPEAIRHCQKGNQFYVQQIGEKELVSWRWNGHWYTAISNHKGSELIALLQ